MVTKYDFFDGECHAQNGHGDYVKDEDYEALKADRDALAQRADALAVENAELKAAGNKMFLSAISLMEDHELKINHLRDVKDWERNETPATDAALAAMRLEAKFEGIALAAIELDKFADKSSAQATTALKTAAVFLRMFILPDLREAK